MSTNAENIPNDPVYVAHEAVAELTTASLSGITDGVRVSSLLDKLDALASVEAPHILSSQTLIDPFRLARDALAEISAAAKRSSGFNHEVVRQLREQSAALIIEIDGAIGI